jgi:demethylmenaquinone methyltransferase/2-methoxy-6-polyprenyl-1,4-benzoquinol methylase
MVEFGLPSFPARAAWELYVRFILPAAGALIDPAWRDVGRFLGPSIRTYYAEWPLARQLDVWRAAGVADVQARRLSLGGGVVVWGTRR